MGFACFSLDSESQLNEAELLERKNRDYFGNIK